jgi:hypothetical protein
LKEYLGYARTIPDRIFSATSFEWLSGTMCPAPEISTSFALGMRF